MKVTFSILPADSLTRKYLPADYSDVYAYEVNTKKEIIPDDLMVSFWTDFPAWVNRLFQLRNLIVKPFGLKGAEDNNLVAFENAIRTGIPYNIASVPAKNPCETVLLLTDKHLNAYMAVHIQPNGSNHKVISAITLVHFKNRLGRIYFFVIKPFHGFIVRNMLKRVVERIAN